MGKRWLWGGRHRRLRLNLLGMRARAFLLENAFLLYTRSVLVVACRETQPAVTEH